jgi:hypothetical protein
MGQQQRTGNQQPPLADDQLGQNQGEGNVEAGRHYNRETREFVQSGQVERAAREAAPQSQQQSEELRRAEEEGRSHAKEEDPALKRGARSKPGERQR